MPHEQLHPLSEIIGQLEKRGERLPHEIGAFVALEACESLLRQPAHVAPEQLWVNDHGAGSISPSSEPAAESESVRDLVKVLDSLLEAAGGGVPPSLLAIAHEKVDEAGLAPLRERLIRALMPLNRAASRRVWARMVREAERAALSERSEITTPVQNAKSDVGELQGARMRESQALEADADDARHSDIRSLHPQEEDKVRRSPRRAKGNTWLSMPTKRSVFTGSALLVAALFALAWSQGWLVEIKVPSSGQTASEAWGTLHLEASPLDAQIFVYVGRSPIRIDGLDPKVAHEFVAFDEGTDVSRAIIASNMGWQPSTDGPLYELALPTRRLGPGESQQLGEPLHSASSLASSSALAPGENRGSVRVITTPRGAKVYRYLGRGQRLVVDGFRSDLGHELLFYHHEAGTERVVIAPSDWQAKDGKIIAARHVKLDRSAPSP